jgi:hypothetical protein
LPRIVTAQRQFAESDEMSEDENNPVQVRIAAAPHPRAIRSGLIFAGLNRLSASTAILVVQSQALRRIECLDNLQ